MERNDRGGQGTRRPTVIVDECHLVVAHEPVDMSERRFRQSRHVHLHAHLHDLCGCRGVRGVRGDVGGASYIGFDAAFGTAHGDDRAG